MEQKEEQKQTLGLYLHIPFCRKKCDYCDFYSLSGHETQFKAYQKALLAHLKETAQFTPEHTVDTIYFGGGTPSFFGAAYLADLLAEINDLFSVAPNAEITLEANPDSVTEDSLAKLRAAGFNRLSMGMQSSDDQMLALLGRPHTFTQTKEAVIAARVVGFENLSLDLMYGLPGQTLENWRDTLLDAVELKPEHLSCYGLKLETGTPLYQRRKRLSIPDDDQQADCYLYMVHALQQMGYAQYEVSNFAKPGFSSRHNLKYWTLGEYIGFGPGAHSDFGGVRYSFVRNLDDYIDGVLHNGSVLDEWESLPHGKRFGEYLMLRLRTVQGISEAEYARPYAMEFEPIETLLKKFEEREWAVCEEGRWHFTAEGFLLSNRLIGMLLDAQKHLPVGLYAPSEQQK